MRILPRAGLFVIVVGTMAIGIALVSNVPEAEARPQYLKAFKAEYPKVEKANCKVCHPAESKKVRNDYGSALGEALGGKNVKDNAKITEALNTVAEKESGEEGKTYGDLLNEGKWPDGE